MVGWLPRWRRVRRAGPRFKVSASSAIRRVERHAETSSVIPRKARKPRCGELIPSLFLILPAVVGGAARNANCAHARAGWARVQRRNRHMSGSRQEAGQDQAGRCIGYFLDQNSWVCSAPPVDSLPGARGTARLRRCRSAVANTRACLARLDGETHAIAGQVGRYQFGTIALHRPLTFPECL